MTDVEKLAEKQKMALWHMRDSYVDLRERYGFTTSMYFLLESLIELDGRHYERYGKFNEKERIKIMRAFTEWAFEQEETE
ncbi:hypothetical protein [Listeria booriae]|uniref:Uncharacterized protein n=1 Tax=Listeria booriae TaxID=1552123 RepID=A0A842F4Q9_9LIST|nr:hypothetical protein [Listeria booriae]MBC2239779.1 hypothetical protein [Listeria booriae]